jgi:hypothetical protein
MDENMSVRVGSYVPQAQGAGSSYFSGSVRATPEIRAAAGAGAPMPQKDEYIPSFAAPDAAIIATMPKPIEPPPAPEDTAKSADNADGGESGGEAEVADGDGAGNSAGFTPEEQKAINELKAVDKEVRDHEQAHISAGGPYITGGAAYEYQRGPDGKRYAVGGEVGIDASPVRGNPEATIAKMQAVRSAALAPASPSAQDGAVASAAARAESAARAELSEKRAAEARGGAEESARDPDANGDGAGQQAKRGGNRRAARVAGDAAAAYANAVNTATQAPTVNFAA